MRLSKTYRDTIKKNFYSIFKQGKIYLFGSRIDDTQKGGDIDLYLVIDNNQNLFHKKIKFLAQIKRALGEQKIDVIFNENPNRLIEQEAIKWGIEL